ncbi:MerR family transcriptional regulator [Catenulispora sp. NF23]|uniref:MerR family transcriptional regulator n=1 Tax=Catenulispora pinistramenti TaxID=2705254 RepID=A0ABS5L124_9ACTN|nr:MerR family transcriptional regulator [Catenulispora pinistramenti]MBS2538680.1 MerR family transcriptional regulator [Catenulispora pinistramenti]MBS2552009.1 MerR family transcriptional regulator [Catenulispora pinistramenti]
MDDGDTSYSHFTIGDLARRTGLPVRTIRFYADEGVVPETGRTPAGYRVYDVDAVARLDLVRTLRDLGVDLPTVRRVLAREAALAEVAAAHAEALDVQIRTLRLRRAVLGAVAARGASHQEMDLMHRIARMSDAERRRMIEDFADSVFGGVDANPELVEMVRAATPELPDDATAEQVEAWIELAELTQDPDFRASVRRMAEYQAAERAAGDTTGLHHELTAVVRERIGRAVADGVDPESAAADPVIAELAARYAGTFGKPDDAALREWLWRRLEVAADPRVERYWRLLAAINRWPEPESLGPVFDWFLRALRVRIGR